MHRLFFTGGGDLDQNNNNNIPLSCGVLRCVAVCCGVLQCVAMCCSKGTLEVMILEDDCCVAVCCGVLQCVAVCCSVLQYRIMTTAWISSSGCSQQLVCVLSETNRLHLKPSRTRPLHKHKRNSFSKIMR